MMVNPVVLKAVGDILLSTKSGDGNPFFMVKSTLVDSDIVFGNLEAPFSAEKTPTIKKAVSLKVAPENVKYLKDAGFSVVSLANNHILDFGTSSLMETIKTLKNNGITPIGAGANLKEALCEASFSIGSQKFAFIAFTMGGDRYEKSGSRVAGMCDQLVHYRISECIKNHDFVIVSLHWGTENVLYPSPEQQLFARSCIDAGASIILGHHPHRLQGVEKYKNGIIFYSLGNFNFFPCEPDLCEHSSLTAIAEIRFDEKSAVSYKMIPVAIDNNYCPHLLQNKDEIEAFNSHMATISKPLVNGIDKWWWYGEIAAPYLRGNFRSFRVRIRKYGFKEIYPLIRWLTSNFCCKIYFGIACRLAARFKIKK